MNIRLLPVRMEPEMAEIAALNQNKRYYTGTPQMLKSYVEMLLPVYKQK